MKYVCDVEGIPIPKKAHVRIEIDPVSSNNDVNYKNRKDEFRQRYMISEKIAETLIKWIEDGTLYHALNEYVPPAKRELKKAMNKAFEKTLTAEDNLHYAKKADEFEAEISDLENESNELYETFKKAFSDNSHPVDIKYKEAFESLKKTMDNIYRPDGRQVLDHLTQDQIDNYDDITTEDYDKMRSGMEEEE